jgi:hypothetical protein
MPCRAKILPSKTIRIQRAARDMDPIMADPYPIRPITVEEFAGFRRVPDVGLDIRELGAAYLGGTRLARGGGPRRRTAFRHA